MRVNNFLNKNRFLLILYSYFILKQQKVNRFCQKTTSVDFYFDLISLIFELKAIRQKLTESYFLEAILARNHQNPE